MTSRALPVVTPLNAFFWTSGGRGVLEILRCDACGQWLHPPSPICSCCLGRKLSPSAVSGLATIETFTVNHQAWAPDLAVPYVIAIVALDEGKNLRLTTNIVDTPIDAVRIGQRVRVVFEQHEELYLPLFKPL
jgi:uncharacterized OB-fold protein